MADELRTPEQTAAQPPAIPTDSSGLSTVYTNFCRVSVTPDELVLDFGLQTQMMPNPTETMILFGTSDHVLYPDFDRMAALVFPNRVGPFLLRDCGHFVPWEAPHALVSGTAAFCSDLLASRVG